jgi:hypothetical protein
MNDKPAAQATKKRRWPAVVLASVLGIIALGVIGDRFSPIWPTLNPKGKDHE